MVIEILKNMYVVKFYNYMCGILSLNNICLSNK